MPGVAVCAFRSSAAIHMFSTTSALSRRKAGKAIGEMTSRTTENEADVGTTGG